MSNAPKISNEAPASEDRQIYVMPRLVEVGKLSDLTKSDGNGSASDGGYS